MSDDPLEEMLDVLEGKIYVLVSMFRGVNQEPHISERMTIDQAWGRNRGNRGGYEIIHIAHYKNPLSELRVLRLDGKYFIVGQCDWSPEYRRMIEA
jgi:hypothetical protein